MARSTTLAIKIVGDASSAKQAMSDVDDRAGLFSSSTAAKMAVGATAVVGALGAIAVSAFNAASDLEQSTGAINSVFGDWALDIEQAAQGAAGSVGLSTSAYENLASVLGSQLKGAGMPIDEVTSKTQDLVGMGADLAATFGGSTADAVSALSGVLKGETDPIERYGVSIKQSDINARLAAEGNDKLTGAALKTATANAALALVTEQTKDAHGAFARESDTAAGAQARLSAWWENAKATLGEKLLPVFVQAVDFFTTNMKPAIDALIAQGGPLQTAFQVVSDFVSANVIPTLQALWGFAQANLLPILADLGSFVLDIVVPALAGLWGFVNDYVVPILQTVLGPVLAGVKSVFADVTDAIRDNADKFQDAYDKAKPFLDFLRDNVAPVIGTVLQGALEAVGPLLSDIIDSIAWILDKAGSVLGFLGNLFGAGDGKSIPGADQLAGAVFGAAPVRFGAASASPLRSASAAGLIGGGSSAGGALVAAGDTYQITVNGALDPDAVADQIGALLDRRARRTGQLVAAGRAA